MNGILTSRVMYYLCQLVRRILKIKVYSYVIILKVFIFCTNHATVKLCLLIVCVLNVILLFYFLRTDFNIINDILEGKSCKRRLTFLSPDKEEKVVPNKRKRKLISHVWIYTCNL